MKAREALLDLVFPPHCAFCGAVDARGVCPDCERALPRTRQPLRPIAAGV
nr:double zinc ribbon domain-containing protein [Oscillospiraceae bacterium]